MIYVLPKKKGGMYMGRQIDFNVTGKARGELANAIGEILNKEVIPMI